MEKRELFLLHSFSETVATRWEGGKVIILQRPFLSPPRSSWGGLHRIPKILGQLLHERRGNVFFFTRIVVCDIDHALSLKIAILIAGWNADGTWAARKCEGRSSGMHSIRTELQAPICVFI